MRAIGPPAASRRGRPLPYAWHVTDSESRTLRLTVSDGVAVADGGTVRVFVTRVGAGAAVAVVPVSVPILDPAVRAALAEVVRESLREASNEAGVPRRSDADGLTIVVAPFAPAGFVGFILAAFMSDEHAVIWAVAVYAVTLILMRRADGRELLRRLAEWMAPPDDK